MKQKTLKELNEERRVAQQHRALARYYNLNSILGNTYAMFYCIIGGRKTGKSYAVADYLCRQYKKLGDQTKNYWLRISETSTKAMLANNCSKLIDPDLVRKYDLELKQKAGEVKDHGNHFMDVIPLSAFAKLKGVGYFDKDYTGWYNIVLDEFQLEEGEKRTSFDILYNFIGVLENIARTTKSHIRVFLLGNTLEEASSILKAFNFVPGKFGRFYLKSKRCVIDNIEPTGEYLEDRKGSLADILGGDEMSNYTNEILKDFKLISKSKLRKPQFLIKFGKNKSDWYTVWEGQIIRRYNGETPSKNVIAMKPYLDEAFNLERKTAVLELYDAQQFYFHTLIDKTYFDDELKKIRKTK